MKALLALLLLLTASRVTHHDDTLRANQFNDSKRYSPWLGL